MAKTGVVAVRRIAIIFPPKRAISSATEASPIGFILSPIITTFNSSEFSLFCSWCTKSIAISRPISSCKMLKSAATASAWFSSSVIKTVRSRRSLIINCSTSMTLTENCESTFMRLCVIPGRSSPETRMSPVKAGGFLFGIGSD